MADRAGELQAKLADRPDLPATVGEAALAFDMVRAMLTTLVVHAPGKRIVMPPEYRETARGAYMRMVLDADGTIMAWIEEGHTGLRTGAVYTSATGDLQLGLEDG